MSPRAGKKESKGKKMDSKTERAAPSTAPPHVQHWATGTKVVVHSLVKAAELNGRTGTITRWMAGKGRYVVDLDGRSNSIKPANLQLASTDDPVNPCDTTTHQALLRRAADRATSAATAVNHRAAVPTMANQIAIQGDSDESDAEEEEPKPAAVPAANPRRKRTAVKEDSDDNDSLAASASAAAAAEADMHDRFSSEDDNSDFVSGNGMVDRRQTDLLSIPTAATAEVRMNDGVLDGADDGVDDGANEEARNGAADGGYDAVSDDVLGGLWGPLPALAVLVVGFTFRSWFYSTRSPNN